MSKAIKTAVLKSIPIINEEFSSIISHKDSLLIIALTKFIQWKLKKQGIKSLLFAKEVPLRTIDSLQKCMERQYNALCKGRESAEGLDWADLLQNHLCWEIQKQYYFFITLYHWLNRYGIKKLYYEPLYFKNKKRYAATINQLMPAFCRNQGIELEKI